MTLSPNNIPVNFCEYQRAMRKLSEMVSAIEFNLSAKRKIATPISI